MHRGNWKRNALLAAFGMVVLYICPGVQEAGAADPQRGELLYNTHCIACHTAKMHWRDQRLATDWDSLIVQVRRWQATILLNWDDDDIASAASYLNSLYYRFPETAEDKTLSGK